MSEAWVYIDESRAPHAAAVQTDEPFWLGALTTAQEIDGTIVSSALAELAQRPGARTDPRDQTTLSRCCFHASSDSVEAHSVLCAAIVAAKLTASFCASQWFFGREDSEKHEGARLHRLTAMLATAATVQADFDTVHVVVARREGSFEDKHAANFAEYYERALMDSVTWLPAVPTRFPRIVATAASPEVSGLQVCDFVLWALQRGAPREVGGRDKSDWMKRLGLLTWASGGRIKGAHQQIDCVIGRKPQPPSPLVMAPGVPRDAQDITDQERFDLLREMAADVKRALGLARGTKRGRIGHLTGHLERATEAVGRVRADHSAAAAALNDLARGFLVVCDTLPIYDLTDPVNCARGREKRNLAADFLMGRQRVWFPSGVAL